MRISLFLGLGLAALAEGALFCSTFSPPPLNTCCDVVADNGSVVCYCGTSATDAGAAFTVVVSGSTCTVTNKTDGGGDAQVTGYPPAAVSDCTNLVTNCVSAARTASRGSVTPAA
jgi:hypothetical protein